MKNETRTEHHTPGPWRRRFSTIKAANGADVARIVKGWGVREVPELLANAALISAAPELLSAARLALKDCGISDRSANCPEWWYALDAAIKSAEGENAE